MSNSSNTDEIDAILDWQDSDYITREEAHKAIEDLLIKARIDERESMNFINKDGTENSLPYLQYRFHRDGFVLSWEQREAELQQQLTKNGDKNRE